MGEQNQISDKKSSTLKALLGGISAIGILVGLVMLGGNDFQAAEKLKAEVIESISPTITSLTPASGRAGDSIYITVENMESFSAEEGGVFFGEEVAKISTVGHSESGEATIVTTVPQLTKIGTYPISIVTPIGLIDSPTSFELTGAPVVEAKTVVESFPESEDFVLKEDFTEVGNNLTQFEEFAEIPEDNFYYPAETSAAAIPLTPPSNLQVSSSTNGIELQWEGEANNYNVYYGSRSGSYIHRVASENKSEILLDNLNTGQHYFFMVSAVDTIGNESTGSNEVSAIYSPHLAQPEPANQIFHATSQKPPQLSEEGPAETLLISIIAAFGVSLFFRRKIFAGN